MASRKQKRKSKRRTVRIQNKNIRVLIGGDDKCIFVPLHDGLGNQLFIYAAALVAKKKLKMPLCTLPATLSGHSDKNYRSLLFTNSTPVNSSDPVVKERMEKSTMILKGVNSAHKKWLNTNIVANTSKNVILPQTYFQNYSAIKGIIDEMRTDILSKLEKLYPDLKGTIDSSTSGFMHVRRGDYAKYNQALPKEYYQNALNELGKIEDLKKVYILSNEMDWCKGQNFTLSEGKTIEMLDESDEVKSLYVMSLCKRAAIISASSFSAWGAIFGAQTNANPVIIYPKSWFMEPNSSLLEFPSEKGWKSI